MQPGQDTPSDKVDEIPRVLLENYLLLSAAIENQNLGRLEEMLQYQSKVHENLVDVLQHVQAAPALVMTTTPAAALVPVQQQNPRQQNPQQQHPLQQQQQQQNPRQQHLLQQQQHQRRQQQPVGPPPWLAGVNQPVSALLHDLGLQSFAPLLEQQAVDMAALRLMSEQHLRELGLPLGAVVKIRAALQAQPALAPLHH